MIDENELAPEIQPNEVVSQTALEFVERAMIDCQISTAKRYPRQLARVKNNMLSLATLDEDTAAACFYTLPRGGKSIQGPSVRLAEIALSSFGNARAATRVISEVTDGPNPHVMIQAVCFDLENNIAVSIEKRRRITKKKSKPTIDEDDINLAVNACAAIAFRDAVFKIVPGALVKPVLDAAKKVAIGDVKSLVVKRQKIVDRLKQMGVTEDRICAAVECTKIEEIDLDKLEILVGLGTAIRDGTSLEDAFPPPAHPGTTTRKAEPVTGAAAATTRDTAKDAEKPTSTTAPATNVVQMPQQTQQPPSAPAEDPEEAAAKAEAAKAREEATKKAAAPPPTPPAETTAPAEKAKVPPFDAATHIPMMRAKIAEKGIAIGQLSQYAKSLYFSELFSHLDKCVSAGFAGKPFCMVLFRHLENPEKVALIKTLPGASTVEG